jgi:hypothetical protein
VKLVLATFCGIVILFMGGCAIVSIVAFPLPLIPGAIAVLNLLILGALFGWKFQWKPAFYILGIVDLLLAAMSLFAITGMIASGELTAADTPFFWLATVLFGLKGVLTLYYAKTLPPPRPKPPAA